MRFFVSYARTDRPEVEPLARRLQQAGNDAWLDVDLVGGQVWWDNILHQIRESDAFIAIMSRSSLKSQACQIERQYAARLGKPILPLTIEPLSAGTLPSDISRLQIVDYSRPDEDTVYALIGAIMRLPTPPPLPVPLPEPPDAPSSYWGNIGDQINAQTLTLDQQFAIVGHLESALAPAADPAEIPVALDLLSQMEQRTDLYAKVERRIALLKQNTSNGAAMRSHTSAAGDQHAKLAELPDRGVITDGKFEPGKARITDFTKAVREQERADVQDQNELISALENPTLANIYAAMQEATRVDGLAENRIKVTASSDRDTLSLSFSRSKSDDKPALEISIMLEANAKAHPADLVAVMWTENDAAVDVGHSISSVVQRDRLLNSLDDFDWSIAMVNLKKSIDVAIRSSGMDANDWHLNGGLYELLGSGWAVSSAGLEHRDPVYLLSRRDMILISPFQPDDKRPKWCSESDWKWLVGRARRVISGSILGPSREY